MDDKQNRQGQVVNNDNDSESLGKRTRKQRLHEKNSDESQTESDDLEDEDYSAPVAKPVKLPKYQEEHRFVPKKLERVDMIENMVEMPITDCDKADLWSSIYRGDEEISQIGEKIGKWLVESPK